jgi:predicted DNA-binding protein (MmcQ/YjbR family)
MRTREEALSYGLSFPDTYQDAPFHDENWQLVRYKGNKKAFLWTYERDGFINLNVKVEPDKAFFWRDIYESVMPGYHQNKEHWNTIILSDNCDRELIEELLELSYELTKK